MSLRALTLGLLAALQAGAAEAAWKPSGNAELWAYAAGTDRAGDSPLNPGNRVAELPGLRWTGEARVNLRLTADAAEFVLRPRLLEQHDPGAGGDLQQGYLSQAFARIRLGDALTFTGGRDLLTWGPANFRSPSNPFYFDAGRSDPLREVSGVDLARLTWTRGPLSLMLARVLDPGHLDPAATPAHATLAKLDLRGSDGMASALFATPVWGAPFLGAFAQASPGDAWLVYGEAGSGRRPQALTASPADSGPPFAVQAPSPRRGTVLLGASYTFGNGQSLALEGLRDGHGLTRQDEARFFARADALASRFLAAPGAPLARAQLAALGQALGQAPALLGRDYGSLLWQSNPQESGRYGRLTWTVNLQDRSSQLLAYGEKSLSARFLAFAALTRNLGGVRAEFGDLFRTSLTLGIKCFAF
ncbi:MAG: hypothetical protein P4L36_01795 [Holophaga sp.]|nr:hypothetical protein [Holophaga sp.]